MRKINGEWHMGVDEGRGESIHVYGHVCPKCAAFCPVTDSRWTDGETVTPHECPNDEEGGRDGK